jgi:hypothetical protein
VHENGKSSKKKKKVDREKYIFLLSSADLTRCDNVPFRSIARRVISFSSALESSQLISNNFKSPQSPSFSPAHSIDRGPTFLPPAVPLIVVDERILLHSRRKTVFLFISMAISRFRPHFPPFNVALPPFRLPRPPSDEEIYVAPRSTLCSHCWIAFINLPAPRRTPLAHHFTSIGSMDACKPRRRRAEANQ